MRGGSSVRLLLDTHSLLWWYSADPELPASSRKLIAQSDSNVFVSAASAWEIATKFRSGKLATAAELVQDFEGYLTGERFVSLPVSAEHGVRAGSFPGPLRDPFDRMLIAQALVENLFIVSNEKVFDQYGVRRMW
ncbi:MAG TPA: type II toxin-antitoxin system VapC family toxin [Terriglobales bacterium]|nr:type II toxin-antitoxin system VapC family toxin [Terriglobales bacterium]